MLPIPLTANRTLRVIAALLLIGWPAAAAEFPLTLELDTGITQDFGTVWVEENGEGGLDFELSLDPNVLGSEADLHRLYFNLADGFSGLAVQSHDAVATPYRLRHYDLKKKQKRHGIAGAKFDFVVGFGNGAGERGNGVLQEASFTLLANETLLVEEQFPLSRTAEGIMVQMAVHVQGSAYSGVGGVLEPEPDPGEEPGPDPGGELCFRIDIDENGQVIFVPVPCR
jgi:hypothetical protein